MSIEMVANIAQFHPEIIGYQHFEIDPCLVDFAEQQVLDQFPVDNSPIDWSDLRCSCSARMPAKKITFSCDSLFMGLLQEDAMLDIVVGLYDGKRSIFHLLGGIVPGQKPGVKEVIPPGMDHFEAAYWLATISYVLSLIAEPRMVKKVPNGSRQQRRSAHRGMGFAVDAWTRVSWDISAETVAKVSRDPSFHKVPLHFRRGHWRRALPHYAGAVQRWDALRPEDRGGWFQWIDGQWVGHPAFGLKRSVHAPRLSLGFRGKDFASVAAKQYP